VGYEQNPLWNGFRQSWCLSRRVLVVALLSRNRGGGRHDQREVRLRHDFRPPNSESCSYRGPYLNSLLQIGNPSQARPQLGAPVPAKEQRIAARNERSAQSSDNAYSRTQRNVANGAARERRGKKLLVLEYLSKRVLQESDERTDGTVSTSRHTPPSSARRPNKYRVAAIFASPNKFSTADPRGAGQSKSSSLARASGFP